MEACNEIDAVFGVLICKNLFLCNRQKTNFYLLMNDTEHHVQLLIDEDVIQKFLPATGHDYMTVKLVGEDYGFNHRIYRRRTESFLRGA